MMHPSVAELSRDLAAFLAFKRALGYLYRRGEATLRSFERFAGRGRGRHSRIDLSVAIPAWLRRIPGRKPVTLAGDLGAVRQLCLYRRRRDPSGFLPPVALAPQTESTFAAYLFSHAEVRALLEAASAHPGRNAWPAMLRMLVLCAYCTGLRFGEAVRLQQDDLDLQHNVLFVRQSKGRSRQVPFQADLAQQFRLYLTERTALLRSVRLRRAHDPGALFIGRNGRPVSLKGASGMVRRLLRRLGIKPPTGRIGPRPYDLRHAFAVHRLTAWYHQGVDIHARLPWLSAYMGHVDVLGTETYLHATPELLQLASDRFASRFTRPEARS